MNPTLARSIPMAQAAVTMPAPRSSARSSAVAGAGATVIRGTCTASTRVRVNETTAAAAGQDEPPSRVSPPSAAPATLPTALSRVSFELASTKSLLDWTSLGTTALLATE